MIICCCLMSLTKFSAGAWNQPVVVLNFVNMGSS